LKNGLVEDKKFLGKGDFSRRQRWIGKGVLLQKGEWRNEGVKE